MLGNQSGAPGAKWTRTAIQCSLLLAAVVGFARPRAAWAQADPPASPPVASPPVASPPAARSPEKPVVVWLARSQMPQGDEFVSGLLPRELARQAVLLSVRDELHRLTRDAVLGEVRPPGDSADLSSLRLKLNPGRQQFEVELFAVRPGDEARAASGASDDSAGSEDGAEVGGQQIWRHVFELPEDPFAALVSLVEQLEEISRVELPVALREFWQLADLAGGLAGDDSGDVSAGEDDWKKIDGLLAEPDAFSHFQAIRLLHARRQGQAESADSLSRLARGYANLSILTRHHWQADSTVFGARALLYAQRLKQMRSAGPLQAWQAAYVPAVLGLHWHVLEMLPALEPTWTAELAKEDPWVELVVPVAKCDFRRLQELASADSPTARLAELWRFTWSCYHITSTEFSKRWRETAKACPGAAEVYVRGFFQGMFEDQRTASSAVYRAIPEHFVTWVRGDIGLPESVLQMRQVRQGLTALSGIDREGDVGSGGAFAEAGIEAVDLSTVAATDWHEFTWGVAAELIREELFQAAQVELLDRNNAMSSDLRDTAESMAKVVGPHRYVNYLRVLGIDPRLLRKESQQLMQEIELGDVTATMVRFCQRTWQVSSNRYGQFGEYAFKRVTRDHTATYLMELLSLSDMLEDEMKVELAQLVGRASPEHPMSFRFQMRTGGEPNDAKVNYWLARVKPDDELGLYELARLFRGMDRPSKAVEYYTKTLDLHYQATLQAERARVYWSMRRYDEWERDMRAALPRYEDGMVAANAHWEFASKLMEIGKWDASVEPAEQAATVGSAWGFQSAGTAYELTSRLEESEKMFEMMSRSYNNRSRAAWYLWCHRNGYTENLKAARRLLAEFTRSPAARHPDVADFMGTIALLEENQEKALEYWLKGHQSDLRTDGWYSMMAAWLANEMGKTELRDSILEEFRPKMEEWRNQYRFSYDEPIDTLTYTIAECLKGNTTPERLELIEFYFNGLWFHRRQEYGFLVGKVFEKAGEPKKAEYYWKVGLRGPHADGSGATLAGAELVKILGPRDAWDTAADRERKQP